MTDTSTAPTAVSESVGAFAARARAWLADNMPRIDPGNPPIADRGDETSWLRARELQKMIYDGGFAGICFPRAYGGLGLSFEYQKAFDAETVGYEMPLILNTPSFSICCATLLDVGTEDQKYQHISAALKGEQILVQLLSEPSGGSDLAAVLTRAEHHGDTWVINGAKTWSTSAFAADYGLLLARTDWTVPKHQGLTMFLTPVHAPGITMRRIQQVDGSDDFCEEFFDGLHLPDESVVGEVDKGWDVVGRQLHHERRAVGGGSEFASGVRSEKTNESLLDLRGIAEEVGQAENINAQDKIGRVIARRMVRERLIEHVSRSVRDGSLPPTAGTLIRLFHSEVTFLEVDTAMEIAGFAGMVDEGNGLMNVGMRYLSRQTVALGGGSDEMARNVIGERLLGFPREPAADRGVPFNQVKHNRTTPNSEGRAHGPSS